MKKINLKLIMSIISLLLVTLLFVATIKGAKGDPLYYQKEYDTAMSGPFESTNSSARYATVQAIVDEKTLFFDDAKAKVSAPDIVKYDGNVFSIFTPGVSFYGIPFYVVGKIFDIPQLMTFVSTIVFAVVNYLLIVKITKKIGASHYVALLSGFVFLFATNAFVYALTFTQHHASTTIILLGLLNALGKRTVLRNAWFGVLLGFGLLIDIPNLIVMLPIGIYIFVKHLNIVEKEESYKMTFNFNLLSTLASLAVFLIIFGLHNYLLTGSYLKIGQMIGRSDYFETEENLVVSEGEDSLKLPFRSRNQLQGLMVLLVNTDSGIAVYMPVMLLGIVGLYIALKEKKAGKVRTLAGLSSAFIITTIIMYSMHGDPWGGWSFGSRYMIPVSALLSVFLGLALTRFKKNIPFILLFLLLAFYSLGVNVLGATTTADVPPKEEAIRLEKPIPHTYEYNFQLMQEGVSSSLLYNLYFYDKTSAGLYVVSLFLIASTYILIVSSVAVLDNK